METISIDLTTLLTIVSTVATAYIAAYFGYKQVQKKSESEMHTTLMTDVNSQNAELRQYLSDQLKEANEKHRKIVEEFEHKFRLQEEEIQQLKRDREHLQMKIFKIRLLIVKYGIETTDLDDIEDLDEY